jgi:hypothetical protein
VRKLARGEPRASAFPVIPQPRLVSVIGMPLSASQHPLAGLGRASICAYPSSSISWCCMPA